METHSETPDRAGETAPISATVADFARQWGIDPNLPTAPTDHDELTRRVIDEARRKDAASRFFADIGAEYHASDWSHPAMQFNRPQIDRIVAWEPGQRGILATGPTGLGKTRAITALYRRLAVVEGRDVRYWNAADFFATLGEQVRYGRDDGRGWVSAMAAKPIFILDDLGQEAVTKSQEEWAHGWFFRFLDIRRERGLPLIASTNLSAQQIAGKGDAKNLRADPLLQRLLDLCEVVKFLQPSNSQRI